jgi:hypothetical protein
MVITVFYRFPREVMPPGRVKVQAGRDRLGLTVTVRDQT